MNPAPCPSTSQDADVTVASPMTPPARSASVNHDAVNSSGRVGIARAVFIHVPRLMEPCPMRQGTENHACTRGRGVCAQTTRLDSHRLVRVHLFVADDRPVRLEPPQRVV